MAEKKHHASSKGHGHHDPSTGHGHHPDAAHQHHGDAPNHDKPGSHKHDHHQGKGHHKSGPQNPTPQEKQKSGDKAAKPGGGKNKPQKKPAPPVKKLLIGEEAKRAYSQRLMCGLAPVRLLSTLFGQFPFSSSMQKNGTCLYKFSWLHLNTLYFLIMMFICFYALIIGGWNLFMTITGAHEFTPTVEQLEQRWYEKSLLHRHLIWVISIFSAIIQACCSYVYLWKNRHYMPSVLTFYTKVVQQLHMDISNGVLSTILILILIYIVSFVAIIVMGVVKFAPVTIGAPTLLGIYMFRFFLLGSGFWSEHGGAWRITLQLVGAVFLILIFTASKIQMIMFVFHCKILKNAFACWNGRAYVALMKGGKYFLTQEGKLTYKLLYKDHSVLLDMMEATNRLCTGTMEVYYGLQTATIFFEIYFFIRAARYGYDKNKAAEDGGLFFIRPNDWIPGILLACQSILFAMYTAKVAISVGQEAMAGLDIVRRKTMLHRKTDDELLFQLSMQASFNSFQRFDICGGGYQYINTDWIMGYVNNIGSYFIILYQFQPAMDRSTKKEWERRENLGRFLTELEGLENGHYLGASPPPLKMYGPIRP